MIENGKHPQVPSRGMGANASATFSLRLRPGSSGPSSNGNRTANPEYNSDLASNGRLSEAEYERLVHSQQYGWMLD